MKLSSPLLAVTTAAICSASASAFINTNANKLTPPGVVVGDRMRMQNARVDTTEAIKEAMKASKEFGPTSKEARVAWEAVEEMDASDNS